MIQPTQSRKLSWWLKGWEEAGLASRREGHTTGSEFWSNLSPPREPLNWRIWLNRTARAFLKSYQVLCSLWKAKSRVCFSFLFPNLGFFVFLCSSHYTIIFFLFTPFPLICEFSSHLRLFPPCCAIFLLIPNSSCHCTLSRFSPRFSESSLIPIFLRMPGGFSFHLLIFQEVTWNDLSLLNTTCLSIKLVNIPQDAIWQWLSYLWSSWEKVI